MMTGILTQNAARDNLWPVRVLMMIIDFLIVDAHLFLGRHQLNFDTCSQ